MTDLKKAAEMALEALEAIMFTKNVGSAHIIAKNARYSLREALAKGGQKPTLFFGRAVYFADPKTGEKLAQPEQTCCCGEPTALGVVHRKDNPCYVAQPEHEINWWYDKEYVKNRFGAAAKVVGVRRGLPAGSFKPISEPVKERISEPVENLKPVAYLYHDTACAELANPLADSTLLVLAYDRKPNGRNETPLYTAPPKREQWTPVEIGVDVTLEGAFVVGMYVLMPEAVRHVFYSQFHPAPKREWIDLSDEEYDKCDAHETWRSMQNVAQMLKEKNT